MTDFTRERTLVWLASAVAAGGDLQRAVRIISVIEATFVRDDALGEVSRIAADAGDVGIAEELARSIGNHDGRCRALCHLALVTAAGDARLAAEVHSRTSYASTRVGRIELTYGGPQLV